MVRENLGKQKRNSRRGLSKLLGKTRPSHPIAGEVDKFGLYSGQYTMYVDTGVGVFMKANYVPDLVIVTELCNVPFLKTLL